MKNLLKVSLIAATMSAAPGAFAQDAVPSIVNDTIYNPDIIYSPIPKVYEIAGIKE